MAYLIHNEAPVENEHIQADYPNLDERLFWCVKHTRAMCWEDNKALHSLLKSKTVNGPLWTFVESFKTAKDGCGAYLSIHNHLEGPNSVRNCITKAYNEMQNLKFNDKSKNFTMDMCVQRHQACHNILADAESGDVVSETKKFTDFVNGLQTPWPSAAITMVQSGPVKHNTFHAASLFIAAEHQ